MGIHKDITPNQIWNWAVIKCQRFANDQRFRPIVVFSEDRKTMLGQAMIDYNGSNNYESATIIMYSCELKEQITLYFDFPRGFIEVKHNNERRQYFRRDPRSDTINGVPADVIRIFV